MSQFPDTDLGNALRISVKIRSEFYREYVTQDHNHEYISKISQVAAMALIQSSPYRPFLTSYIIDNEAHDDLNKTPRYIMNKGAVRIVPTVQFRDVLKGIHKLLEVPDENHELWDRYRGWLADFYKSDEERYELWVYNHDGKYYLTRPRKKPLKGLVNQKLNQILRGINANGLGDAPFTARRAFLDLAADLYLTKEDEDVILKGSGCHSSFKFTHLKENQ